VGEGTLIDRFELPTGDECILWKLHASEQHLLWVAAAEEIGIFRALAIHPASAEEVAEQFGIGLVTGESLLAVLAGLEFLVKYGDRFCLTATARDFLLPESPYYRGAWLEFIRRRPRRTYAMVYDAILQDQTMFPAYWDSGRDQIADGHSTDDQVQEAAHAEALHQLLIASDAALAARGDFSRVRRLLDVGGGSAGASICLALRYPDLYSTVLDLPMVCQHAMARIARYAVGTRVDTVAADAFTDTWPAGYDSILFSHFLDCFDRARCETLVAKAFQHLPAAGRLFVHEMLLTDAKDEPFAVAALSLHNRQSSGGQQWSASEVIEMTVGAGFVTTGMTPTHGYSVLITVEKR
jgi:hypothetical protein